MIQEPREIFRKFVLIVRMVWSMNDYGNSASDCLMSESGTFCLDADGVARHFEAAEGNPLLSEYHGYCRKAINSFVVPHGVKGLDSRILSEVWVREKFELPEGLVHIGRGSSPFGPCAFTKCDLPTVVIPPSVETLGAYAFAKCQIQRLRLPILKQCPYERQFKGASIGVLELPVELQDLVRLKGEHLAVCDKLPGETVLKPDYGCLRSLCCNADSIGILGFY